MTDDQPTARTACGLPTRGLGRTIRTDLVTCPNCREQDTMTAASTLETRGHHPTCTHSCDRSNGTHEASCTHSCDAETRPTDDRSEDYRQGYADGHAAALEPLRGERGPRNYAEQHALLHASLDNIKPPIHFFEPPDVLVDYPRSCVHCGVLRNDHPRPTVADLLAERDGLAGGAS